MSAGNFTKHSTKSLDALTGAVLARRQELTAMVTEVLVRQRYAQALGQKNAPCPHCSRLLPARGLVSRTVETLVGEVALERPYFYCLECQQGFYPLDEALELAERRKQWDIQEAGAKLAAEVPFETAQELFSQLTGLSLGERESVPGGPGGTGNGRRPRGSGSTWWIRSGLSTC
jgi:hypothetical protein